MSPRPLPHRRAAHGAALATTAMVAVGAVLVPTAHADTGASFSNGSQGPAKPGKPGNPGNPGRPQPGRPEVFKEPAVLKPTAQPVTDYQMPFPCGEVWTGSTRAKHSPSQRAVDFNRTDDLGDSVIAAAAGVVTKAVKGKKKPSYGQYVVIDHGDDESTLYAHLDSVSVAVGQTVERGFQLGTVGNTGNSFGAHLHFEERDGDSVVDAWFNGSRFAMGSSTESLNCADEGVEPPADIPLAGNVIGTKTAELVLFRSRTRTPAFRVQRPGKRAKVIKFGAVTDQPLLGDWEGNGRVNPGVRDAKTKTFRLKHGREITEFRFGGRADLPIAGDWDGLGNWEVGVRRAGTGVFWLRSATGSVTKVSLGDADDLPVTGDWDGDGATDLGVYDPTTSTFTLHRVDADGLAWLSDVAFGTPGDVPVTGDWDGNGATDLGVWNAETATFSMRKASSPTASRAKVIRTQVDVG